MDLNYFRSRLESEHSEVNATLRQTLSDVNQDQRTGFDVGDLGDRAQPVAVAATGDAIAEALLDRLLALERALKRLDDGTYGLSVLSGVPVPEERLEADPAAELTIEEAAVFP